MGKTKIVLDADVVIDFKDANRVDQNWPYPINNPMAT